MATDLDRLLANTKKAWEAATDPAKKAQLHEQANQLRAMGAREDVANRLAYGADEGARRTQAYSAGYGAAPSSTTTTRTTSTPRTTTTAAAPAGNEHARFIEETWPGGMNAYLAMQAQKLQQAQATGNWDMMERLIDDSRRVGYDLSSLMGFAPQQPAQQFSMSDIQKAIDDAFRAASQPIPVPPPRLQDPSATMEMIQAFYQAMQPITEVRIAELTADHNRQMQQLRRRLGAQGALGGGGASLLQTQAAESLTRALDAARAEQLATAIPLGTSLSQAAAEEAVARFNMAQANRAMEIARHQNLVSNLLSALQFGEGVRQFDMTFPLSVAQLTGTYQGQPTLAAQQLQAGLTGTYQGQPTLDYLQIMAGLTGIIPEGLPGAGQPTFAAQQAARAGSGGAGGGLGATPMPKSQVLAGVSLDVRDAANAGEYTLPSRTDLFVQQAEQMAAEATAISNAPITYRDIMKTIAESFGGTYRTNVRMPDGGIYEWVIQIPVPGGAQPITYLGPLVGQHGDRANQNRNRVQIPIN